MKKRAAEITESRLVSPSTPRQKNKTKPKQKQSKTIQNVSELCLRMICIICFGDGGRGYSSQSLALLYLQITKGLFPVPCTLPRRDYQREETGFHVGTLRLCYRLVPGEAALGTSAGGKLPFCAALVTGREASRLAWRSGIPILLTFGGISVGSALGLQNLVVVDCSYIKS